MCIRDSTIIFHIIFPSFTIGLSAYIATLGAMWLRSGEDRYHRLMRFWTKIFAVSFAMGVVSGIVLSYQIGTNWSRFSVFTGNVLGPLLGYVVLAVGARYVIAGRHIEEGRIMLRMAIGLTAILAPLQLLLGDQHGLNTLAHQPIKIAAIEAHWDGSKPDGFHLFAWPDEQAGVNRFEISIPNGASLILTHRMNGLFPGLNSVPASDRPPVKI